MRSNPTNFVLWAIFAVFLLCFIPVYNSDILNAGYSGRSTQSKHAPRQPSTNAALQSRDNVFRSLGHQNPAKAPPVPMPLESTQLLPGFSSRELHTFGKRDALRCDNGVCNDDSCCNKDHICGYGPDFCTPTIGNVEGNCLSKCNATAMCGKYSEDGAMPCGMKLCCSAMGWCGTTESFCGNADPLHGTLPCQAGYGSCAITGSPSKDPSAKSTDGRKIGYYQSWNIRNRLCGKVSPQQLNTDGYTHLFYSFASIDPKTFEIKAAHADDDAMMRDFTSLAKTRNLKTWIAVGGFDFSDPGSTHTTWSDMVSTKSNRAAFIASALVYMNKYGFTGIDLDWEYPGDPERGGKKLADVRNFPMLLREMRAAYGTEKGISLTLAPDYWYLRWFDAKAMQPYVDFFGFMAYDLHGSWDSDRLTLGRLVRGQADIREISNNTVPLWFDGLDPAKINFGLALYGRGYTLTDPKCNDLLCGFTGASKPGPCTNSAGVMSLNEIKQLIKTRGLTPKYLTDSMMKQITWDDQWIGYDDEETFAAKKKWADGKGFGGTMIWSIDFQETAGGGGGGNETNEDPEKDYGPVFYVGPEVFTKPTAQCIGPCNMVFAPSTLTSTTTITPGPYTTSIAIGTNVKVTTKITVTPPPITVTVISFYNIHISTSQTPGPITLLPSVELPPMTITVTGEDKKTTLRDIILPPWPRMLNGPPESWTSKPTTSGGTSNPPPSVSTWNPPPGPPLPIRWPWNTMKLPITRPPVPTLPLPPLPPIPTSIPWPIEIKITPLDLNIDINLPPPLPLPDVIRLKCSLWFFLICIKWGSININFWDVSFPKLKIGTIIGPGPPPIGIFKLPPGWSIKGKIPPWPRIEIGPDMLPIIPANPAACETMTATMNIVTASVITTVIAGKTSVTTSTISQDFTMLGCNIKDDETATTIESCVRAVPTLSLARRKAQDRREHPKNIRSDLSKRAPCIDYIYDGVLYIKDQDDVAPLKELLEENMVKVGNTPARLESFTEIRSESLDFTAYFYLKNVYNSYLEMFQKSQDLFGISLVQWIDIPTTKPIPRRSDKLLSNLPFFSFEKGIIPRKILDKRVSTSEMTDSWALSQLSVPPGTNWGFPTSGFIMKGFPKDQYKYKFDSTAGAGQYIYIVENKFDHSLPVIKDHPLETVDLKSYGYWSQPLGGDGMEHASGVAFVAGNVAKKATLISINTGGFFEECFCAVEGLLAVAEHIKKNGNEGKAVVNMSWATIPGRVPQEVLDIMLQILKMLDALKVVLVTGSGNDAIVRQLATDSYPALFKDKLPNLIVVGAADANSRRGDFSQVASDMVYAPGVSVQVGDLASPNGIESGTSFFLATPAVAAMVATWRGLPSGRFDLTSPSTVVKLINKLSRKLYVYNNALTPPGLVSQVWNGQMEVKLASGLKKIISCLTSEGVSLNTPGCPTIDLVDPRPVIDACPFVARRRSTLVLDGEEAFNARSIESRQDSCPLPDPSPDNPDNPDSPGSPGSPGGGVNAPSKTLTWTRGTPSPVCKSNCGKLCTGFYCNPQPTGTPPDFTPPSSNNPSQSGIPSGYYVEIGLLKPSKYSWAVVGGKRDNFNICDPILWSETPHDTDPTWPSTLLGPWTKDSIECVYQPYPVANNIFEIGILYCGDAGSMGCEAKTGAFQECNGGIQTRVVCGSHIKPRSMNPDSASSKYKVEIALSGSTSTPNGKYRWLLHGNGDGQNVDLCKSPLYADNPMTTEQLQSWPTSSLGPFNIKGSDGTFQCTYNPKLNSANQYDIGSVTCKDPKSQTAVYSCKSETKIFQSCTSGGTSAQTRITCYWNYQA